MGNYSDQPDYATSASNHTPDTVNFTTFLDQSAIYCGSDGNISVVMANKNPGYNNVVKFTNLKAGMFLPVIVDYIIGLDANGLEKGTTFNTGTTIANAETGDYTFTANLKPNGSDVNGSVEIRMVMNGTTVNIWEVTSSSTNTTNLTGGTSVFTIPAGAIGENAATDVTIVAGKITTKAVGTVVTDIVTFK